MEELSDQAAVAAQLLRQPAESVSNPQERRVGQKGSMGSRTVFIRRATVFLLFLCALLSIGFVVVLTLLLKPSCESKSSAEETDTSTTIQPPTQLPQEPWQANYRIPEYTVPLAYDLYLFPNLIEGTFTGKVNILIDLKQPTDYLVVHVKYLDINETKSKLYVRELHLNEEGEEMNISEQLEYEPNEFWVVKTDIQLKPKQYTLHLEFSGNLTRGIVGFYRSIYKTKSGETRYMASSKFQPTYARRAFPCFDEPSFKSNFTVTLVKPSDGGYIALSNMDVEKERSDAPIPGFTEVKFRESVPMVTYLACFIVCDFTYIEKKTQSGKSFRVYAQTDQISRAKYSLEIGTKILNYFENYFGIEYPLPKQDMIAIPDFVSGAMEHWGLITYRETSLLYDDKESSSSNKQRVATVVSHELVHMWFGNLMTLKWWNDLWLNEGFASYIEYKGVNEFEQDWDILAQFLPMDLHRVMSLDDILSSHPIVQQVNHPDEITEIFDVISYSKGASVLRMLESFLGNRVFQTGIQNFLREFKFKNAETKDLWNHLENVSDLEVANIMDTWTRQMGYPVVNVRKIDDRNFELTQERFLRNPEAEYDPNESQYRYLWDIEISYITSEILEPMKAWMHQDGKPLNITLPTIPRWIKFNVGQVGYYRVNYPVSMWNTMIGLLKLNNQILSSSDRSSLISDAFALAEAGYIGYDIPLGLTESLKNDLTLVPWSSARKLMKMESLLYTTAVSPHIKKFMHSLTENLFTKLGWEDTGTHPEKLLRIQILEMACLSGNQECLDGAQAKFNNWVNQEGYYIPPNLRSKVYKYGMKASNNSTHWDVMWKRYLDEQNAQERIKLLYGLAQTTELWRLHRYLELAQNESYVRRQDFFSVIRYIAGNRLGNDIVWDFFRSEWESLVERFTLNSRYLGRSVLSITSRFTTKFQLEEVEHFFSSHPEAGAGRRARQQALETIKNNIKWVQNYKAPVFEFFQQIHL